MRTSAPAAGAAGTVFDPATNAHPLQSAAAVGAGGYRNQRRRDGFTEPPRTIRKCDPPLVRQDVARWAESSAMLGTRRQSPLAAAAASVKLEERRELFGEEKNLLRRQSMMRGQLAEIEDELESLKAKISENLASTFPPFPVIKDEQLSDSSDNGQVGAIG